MISDNFISFMCNAVLPRRATHPSHTRLDGATSGSSRKIFGFFRHHGKVWSVDEDTRYEQLLIAYNAAIAGTDPFVEEPTDTGIRAKLVLKKDLRRLGPQHMYIYTNE